MQNFINHYEQLEEVLRSASIAFILKDCQNNVIKMNEVVADKLGIDLVNFEPTSAEALFGRQAFDLYEDDLRIIESKVSIRESLEEFYINGEKKWIKTDKIPVFDERGDVINIMIISYDVTNEVAVNENMKTLEYRASLGEEFAEMIHNLKSQLAIVVANTTLAMREQDNLSRLKKIEKANHNIVSTVNSYLEGTRCMQEREKLSKVVLNAEVEDVINELAYSKDPSLWDYCHVSYSDICDSEIQVTHFRQIFSNLLCNAIEELENIEAVEKKEIQITLRNVGSYNLLFVEDNGRGILESEMEKIFEACYTTKLKKESKDCGTGLGLSSVKRIVESYGGKVSVINKLTGGVSFIIALPVSQV